MSLVGTAWSRTAEPKGTESATPNRSVSSRLCARRKTNLSVLLCVSSTRVLPPCRSLVCRVGISADGTAWTLRLCEASSRSRRWPKVLAYAHPGRRLIAVR